MESPPQFSSSSVALANGRDEVSVHPRRANGVRSGHSVELEALLREVLEGALAVHRSEKGMLCLCDHGSKRLEVRVSSGFAPDFVGRLGKISPGTGACRTSYQRQERVIVEDVERDPIFQGDRETAKLGGYRAVHSTPLVTRSGRIIGVLSVYFEQPVRPTEQQIHLMDLYARQAADVIDGARWRESAEHELEERRRAEARLELQVTVSQILGEAASSSDGSLRALRAICERAGWDVGTLWVVDKNTARLKNAHFWADANTGTAADEPFAQQTRELELATGIGLPGHVWQEGAPLWISDLNAWSPFLRLKAAAQAGLRSAVAFPIRLERSVIGVIECFSRSHLPIDAETLRALDGVGAQIGQFIERKHAEAALRLNHRRFELAAHSEALTLYEQDAQLRYVWLYPLHPEHAHALGRTDTEIQTHDEGEKVAALKREVMATGVSRRCEVRAALPTGLHYYDLVVTPRRNDEGEIVGVAGAALDITDRRAVAEANRRLASIVESSTDAIISKDLNGIITSWNAGAQMIFGYTAQEAIGRSILMLIPPERHGEEPVIIRRIRAGERIDHFETVRRHKSGKLLDISLNISPLYDATGILIGASKIARDITEKKRVEQQQDTIFKLVARVNRADELPEIYEAALDAICRCHDTDRASILLCDADGVMRFKAWRSLSEGYRRAVEGHSPWRLDDPDPQPVCIEDVDTAPLDETLRQTVLGEGVRALVFIPLMYEKRLLGKFMLYYGAPRRLTGDFGPAQAIASQVAFAIERQKSGEALEALVSERTKSLREAIAQMEEFSYSVSHDLRSPVRAMNGYAKALIEDYAEKPLDATARGYLERIVHGATRMDRLILDVLTYSRLTRREVELQSVNLDALLRQVVEHYPELQAPQAEVRVQSPLLDVIGHEPSLSQAISNVLNNAVKFVAPGVRPEVTVWTERRDGAVRLAFKDNGIGIDPTAQRRLFGMFERLHADKKYPGTGIGLAIARKAVERMNGRIGVDSDGTAGCIFWIELPEAKSA